VLLLPLGGATAIALVARHLEEVDDRIGQICVVPAPTGERDRRLEAATEIYAYVHLNGERDDCVSSSSFSRVPEVTPIAASRWRVVGGFVDAEPDRPLTPDCNGGLVSATLGTLASGSYVVESSLGELRFALPDPRSAICVSRR